MKQKYHWVHFVLANYFWVWGLSQNVISIPNGTPLKKIYFSIASKYEYHRSSLLSVRPKIHFPFSVLGPYLAWIYAGLVHNTIAPVCSHVQHVYSLWKLHFLGVIYHLQLLKVFLLLLQFPETWREVLHENIPIRTEVFKVSQSHPIFQLKVTINSHVL